MTDTMQATPPQPVAAEADHRLLAIIGYGLFLVGLPFLHMPTVAGVILAYIKRDDVRGTIWESHFDNMISTFWIALVVGIAAIPLCFILIGIPIEIGIFIWFLYRTIKGLIRAIEYKPYY
ncbi:MAG: hypothetical protein WDM89_13570 [Rhizomicrobium sp.]